MDSTVSAALAEVLTAVENAEPEYDPSDGAFYDFVHAADVGAVLADAVARCAPAALVGEVAYPAAFSRVGRVPLELQQALAPHEQADGRTRAGSTTLHLHLDYLGSFAGFEERVEALLHRGATPDLQNASGDTALHLVLRKSSGACRRKYSHGTVRTVFDAGADDELWFDDDERVALVSRTAAAVRLWRALVAAGWSPQVPNAAGETPLQLLRLAREQAAQLTERTSSHYTKRKREALAALDLWDTLYSEQVGQEGEPRHPAAVAAVAALEHEAERRYAEELSYL